MLHWQRLPCMRITPGTHSRTRDWPDDGGSIGLRPVHMEPIGRPLRLGGSYRFACGGHTCVLGRRLGVSGAMTRSPHQSFLGESKMTSQNRRSMKSAVVLMSVIVPAIGVVSMSIAGWAQAPQGGAPLVDGIWQTYVPTGGLWTVTLKLDGTQLTGSGYQDMDDPTDIYEGRVEDRTVVFKTENDDSGCRTITFTGKVNAGEIAFTRDVQVREGCNPGGTGIYGARAVREFAAKRVAEWDGLLSPSPSSHTAASPAGTRAVVLWDRGHHTFHVGSVKVPEAQRAWVSRDG